MAGKLGKGLEALIPEDTGKAKEKEHVVEIGRIRANIMQPRKIFNEETMEDLTASIKEKGVIQPLLVRQENDGYEIIAGERRWRAAKRLGMKEVPVIIKKGVTDELSLELALIENIQREDINPIEEAKAYKLLSDSYGYTLDKIGQVVGKKKTTISNSLRLLHLNDKIQSMVASGEISVGHAKVILSITSGYRREKLAETAAKHGLSVRQLELMIEAKSKRKRTTKEKDPEALKIEEELQHKLGTKVNLIAGKKRGRIEIQYYSTDDLERLLKIILS